MRWAAAGILFALAIWWVVWQRGRSRSGSASRLLGWPPAGAFGRGAKVLSRVPLTPTAVLVTVELPDHSLISMVVGGPVRVVYRTDSAEEGKQVDPAGTRFGEAAGIGDHLGLGSPFYDRR